MPLLVQAGASVDEFLTSLDLEKYSITFQAEEVSKIIEFFEILFITYLWENIFLPLSVQFHVFMQVDMTALVHMTDEDLKALGIPMVN